MFDETVRVGFTLQPVAQSRIPVETAGIMYALNPLTAGVLGWIVLDESMGISGIIGAVLILAGILGMRKVQGG